MTSSIRDLQYTLLLALTVLAYATILLMSPELGPTDDYAFLSTLQSGKPFPIYGRNFPFFDDARMGRFDPLVAQEYNLVALVSRTPAAYFLFNAIQLFIFAFLLYRILREATDDHRIVVGAMLLILFSTGFTNAWFRLELGEREAAFFLAIFLWSHMWLRRTGSLAAAALAVVSATTALYYKEPVFLGLLAYTSAHLALSWRTSSNTLKAADGLVAINALVFIALYYLGVYAHRGPWQYGSSPYPWVVVFTKTLLGYGLFSDSLVIFLAIPLAVSRGYRVLRGREPVHPVFDSMLLAGCAYASVFFALHLYGPYYFLPVYVFVLSPMAYYFATKRYLAGAGWKVLAGVAGVVLVLGTIPASLYYLSFNKLLPVNFNKTIDFLVADIRTRVHQRKPLVFLDGVDRARDRPIFLIFGEFLQYRGLTLNDFDMESDVEPTRPLGPPLFRERYLAEYGVYRGGTAPTPGPGDYLVITPDSPHKITEVYLASLTKEYRLVFATPSRFAFPDYTLKTLFKSVLASRLTYNQRVRFGLEEEKLFDRPEFYVFIHQ